MKEFKVTQKSKSQTVYTLESASAGGTSAGAVASVSSPLGGVRRRNKDNILANSVTKEAKKKNEPKINAPRNPVAHAHQNVSGGSGTHKDRSKTIPRKEKYKKNFDMNESTEDVEISRLPTETLEKAFEVASNMFKTSDLEAKEFWRERLNALQTELIKRSTHKTGPQKSKPELSLVPNTGKKANPAPVQPNRSEDEFQAYVTRELKKVLDKKGQRHLKSVKESKLLESTDHEASMARSELYRNAKYGMAMIKMIRPGQELEGWVESCLTKAASGLDKVYHYLDYQVHAGHGIDQSNDMDAEVFEDGSEADTALENLMSIVEYSTKLYKMIKEGDDLEGWIFMKLTKASECVSSAKHHLEYLHFKEHGMDEEFAKSLKKKVSESSELSKQQVINHFVSRGKTAAQGASAYERGWRGPKSKAPPKATPKKQQWLPYADDDIEEGFTHDPRGTTGIPHTDKFGIRSRGVNLPVADTKDLERYSNYNKWTRDVERVNSELLDDRADFKSDQNGVHVTVNGKRIAAWSHRNKNGDIDIRAAREHGVSEDAPKGWEGTVKSMKKHKDKIDNPYALTNWMKKKGYKSHKK